MSGSEQRDTEVKIDRLVLEIPGLDPAQARLVAQGIAAGLATAGVTGEHARAAVQLANLHGAPQEMANRIVAALRERLA
jgi:hypothetical protein